MSKEYPLKLMSFRCASGKIELNRYDLFLQFFNVIFDLYVGRY